MAVVVVVVVVVVVGCGLCTVESRYLRYLRWWLIAAVAETFVEVISEAIKQVGIEQGMRLLAQPKAERRTEFALG